MIFQQMRNLEKYNLWNKTFQSVEFQNSILQFCNLWLKTHLAGAGPTD